MKSFLGQKIVTLAQKIRDDFGVTLYVVGGSVRNFILTGEVSGDIDLAAPLEAERFVEAAKECGFFEFAVYDKTGTVKCSADGAEYEFARFRSDDYNRGGSHAPSNAVFTDDIKKDAKRRDFRCNAVYYDILEQKFVDPLGGIIDVKARILSTVVDCREVFSHDGLRLMRLARFAGELGFTPTEQTLAAAEEYADNVKDVCVERVYEELKKILHADEKYSFSPRDGSYIALKVLDKTRVLDRIIPELTQGRGMAQRSDFHNFDVLEHSLRCVLYANSKIRLAALLHDVGKPFCMAKKGRFFGHADEGEKIAREILTRLKAPKKVIEKTAALVKYHMYDLDCKTSENKMRRFIVKNQKINEELLLLMQADYSACKDDLSIAPAVKRRKEIIEKMKSEGVPFCYDDLALSAKDLVNMGFCGKQVGEILEEIFIAAVNEPHLNQKITLEKIALKNKNRCVDI